MLRALRPSLFLGSIALLWFVSPSTAAERPEPSSKDEVNKEAEQPRVENTNPIKPERRDKEAAGTKKPAVELPPGKVVFAQTDVERRVHAALREPTEMQYLDTLLGDVRNDLELRHSIPIAIDEAALAADGKEPKKLELSAVIREATLANALKQLLAQHALTYIVRNDCLTITTKAAADEWTPIRVYQVHDLLLDDEDAANLSELICAMVNPESWRAAGGTQGEVKSFVGPGVVSLVITQTEDAHEQIEGLLSTLREARDEKVLEAQKEKGPSNQRGGGFF